MSSLRRALFASSLFVFACSTNTPISDTDDTSHLILDFIDQPQKVATSLQCTLTADGVQDMFTLPDAGQVLAFPMTQTGLLIDGVVAVIDVSCTAFAGTENVGTAKGTAKVLPSVATNGGTTTVTVSFAQP